MKNQVVSVTEFKAKCLALLDGVAERGDTITITRRGKPLAKVAPVKPKPWKSLEGILAGKVTIPQGLLDPNADTADLWEVVHDPRKSRI
ncbi:MAG TPA: type II toxin-antitoxin system prevent-host-death family antitoxin [Bryobacteraceae bacterium]|jgi:prevent-host-death family protein|nr:type II toxin-antitoxin system prevent-host-death family antitoxin [Bryobacteraceae bacterium]